MGPQPPPSYCVPPGASPHEHRCSRLAPPYDPCSSTGGFRQPGLSSICAQTEANSRVHISKLEQQLQDVEKQKSALEVCVLELAKINAASVNQSPEAHPRGDIEEVSLLKNNLLEAQGENRVLKTKNEQLNSFVATLVSLLRDQPRADDDPTTRDATKPVEDLVVQDAQEKSSHSSVDISAILVEVTEPNNAGIEEGELHKPMEQNFPSLSSSFSSDHGLTYNHRFVGKNATKPKKSHFAMRKANELPLLQKQVSAALSQHVDSQAKASSPNIPETGDYVPPHLHHPLPVRPLTRGSTPSTTAVTPIVKDGASSRSETTPLLAIHPYPAQFYAQNGQPPNLFRHGVTNYVQYAPTDTKAAYCTIVLSNLPTDVTYENLFSKIRGGSIIQAQIVHTPRSIAKTPEKSALVVFEKGDAAQAYVGHAAKHGIYFGTQKAQVSLVKTPTWPTHRHFQTIMDQSGGTRCFEISHASEVYDPLAITKYLTNPPSTTSFGPLSFIDSVHRINSHTIQVRCISVKAAAAASKFLLNSAQYKGCVVRWVPDPCALGVDTLIKRPLEDFECKVEEFRVSEVLGLPVKGVENGTVGEWGMAGGCAVADEVSV